METAIRHICMNCMSDMGEFEMCANCGWSDGSPPKEMFHLFPRTLLHDRYEVGLAIGSGGFGIIYRAWDRLLGVQVAIKERYPSGLVSRAPGEREVVVYAGSRYEQFREDQERFLAEARKMAKFSQSPYIVNVRDFFEENSTAYIVMEYLDGISLRNYLQQNGDILPAEDMQQIIRPVMEALKAVHAQGIIHRDVSPDNIFLLRDGKVKLLDFGAARLSQNEQELTRSVVLKVGYAPPEQYRSKSAQGPCTDVYALGATVYRMLTGKVPVESTDRVPEDRLELPRSLNPLIDQNLENTILTAMALDPKMRFQSVDEMEKALLGKSLVQQPEEVKRRIAKRRRRLGLLAAASLLAAGGVLISAYAYFMPRQRLALEELEACAPGVRVESMADAAYAQTVVSAAQALQEESGEIITPLIVSGAEAEADLFPANRQSGAADLEKLLRSLQTEDYLLLGEYIAGQETVYALPTGFDLPVIYYDASLFSLYEIPIPYLEDMEAYERMTSLEDYRALAAPIAEVEECLDLVADDRLGLWENPSLGDEPGVTPLSLFASGERKAAMYIGTLRDLPQVQAGMPGYYKVGPLPREQDGSYPIFLENVWSVRESGDQNRQDAAMYLLGYLLYSYYQEMAYIEGNSCAPLHREVFSDYITTKYPELFWLEEMLPSARFT